MKTCSYCGKENAEESIYCQECGTELSERDVTTTVIKSSKSPTAGFWIRAVARLMDTVVGLLAGFVAGRIAGGVLRIFIARSWIQPGWHYRLHRFSLLSYFFALLGTFAYHFFCEGIHGATLGKLCCGLRVVSEDGNPPTARGVFIRNVAFYIDGIFFGIIGYNAMEKSPLNQRNGDVWGKTMVVKMSEMPESADRTSIFLLGLAAGLVSWIYLLATGITLKALGLF